jgi:hypothetical protein
VLSFWFLLSTSFCLNLLWAISNFTQFYACILCSKTPRHTYFMHICYMYLQFHLFCIPLPPMIYLYVEMYLFFYLLYYFPMWLCLTSLTNVHHWIMFFFFFLRYWGLNIGPTPWATPPILFCEGFFQDRVSQTICPGWLQTTILLISASWVARIRGVSRQGLAWITFWFIDMSSYS